MLTKYANVATMKSSGYEATLSTKNIQTKDFNWTTDLTFSYAKNEITDLESRSNVINLITGTSSDHFRVGYPRSALFSIPFMGLNDEGLPTFLNENNDHTVSDIYFQEYEKLGFLVYEGPTEPTITGGLNNMLSWKNWRLNVFITYSFGNKVRLDPQFSAGYSDMSAMPKEFRTAGYSRVTRRSPTSRPSPVCVSTTTTASWAMPTMPTTTRQLAWPTAVSSA